MADLEKELAGILKSLGGLETKIASKLDDQKAELEKYGGTSTKTATGLQLLETKHDALEKEYKDAFSEQKRRLEEIEVKLNRPFGYGGSEEKSVEQMTPGERFACDKEYKSWLESFGKTGARGTSPTIEIGSTFAERKELSGIGVLRNIFATERLTTIYSDPRIPTRVRDLITVIPTTAESIEYVIENLYTIGAAPVAEGEQKPESHIGFTDDVQSVKTIAHWIPVNRQILADLPALRAYLDLRLVQGLKEVEDRQILYGDGTGQNLLGIMNTPGIQTFLSTQGQTGDTYIDIVRRAITLADLAYYPVTGCVMHPRDWEKIELIKSTEGLYVWVNVATGAEPRLWKVPIVSTAAILEGEALMGAFRLGTALWDREVANIRATDSHNDFFTKNRMVILCEERIALTTFRPKSFVKVKLDAGTPGTYAS